MSHCLPSRSRAWCLLAALGPLAACGSSQPPPASSAAAAAPATGDIHADAETTAAATPSATSAASAPAMVPAPPPATSSEPRAPDRSLNDIRAVVAANRDTFRACYDNSLKTHPGIEGKFLLRFVVNPDGSVKGAEPDVLKSEIRTTDLSSCAIAAVKSLRFPPSRKGLESTVDYPFDFHPRGATKPRPSP